MATVTAILGLCGSGKSTLAKRIVGAEVFDEGVAPGWPNHARFHAALASGKDCVIVEVAYCLAEQRAQFVKEIVAQYPGTTFNWLCLENDPVTANANCRADPARTQEQILGNLEQNARMTARYSYPNGAVVLRIVAR